MLFCFVFVFVQLDAVGLFLLFCFVCFSSVRCCWIINAVLFCLF